MSILLALWGFATFSLPPGLHRAPWPIPSTPVGASGKGGGEGGNTSSSDQLVEERSRRRQIDVGRRTMPAAGTNTSAVEFACWKCVRQSMRTFLGQ